jgi:sugar phosphate isomerase/epimerase
MKYAFMSFSTTQLDLPEMLTLARQLGYDGIEPRAAAGHRHGVEVTASSARRAEIKAQVADSGLALACLATSLRYADPAMVKDQIAETHQYIDLAADIGAPRLRVFGGKIPTGVSRETAIEEVAQALLAVATHAGQRSVTVCLETHDDWCDPAHVVEVMQWVNSPFIGVNWDVMHPVRAAGLTMGQAFALLQPWIRHVHIHDGSAETDRLTLLPIGQGVYDHKRALDLLKRHAYGDFLSGEWIDWEPYETHLPRELATLKRYEAELA